jgi:pimeloyl-ACP methyl ester carboxylesterase
MSEELRLRIHGDGSLPTLIYLPGLHGDWTLVGPFRQALRGRLRFVEITYPRTLTWSLDDYAAGVEAALAREGITRGWLLGESFGSQVVWPLVARGKFQTDGVVLAGGFGRHALHWAIRLADRVTGGMALSLVIRVMFIAAAKWFVKLAHSRYRNSPGALARFDEFVARRTELDHLAAQHRLRLLGAHNPCDVAKSFRGPLFAITGSLDPIVPPFFARRWLRRHCPTMREYRILRGVNHCVLWNAADVSADQIVKWVKGPRKD